MAKAFNIKDNTIVNTTEPMPVVIRTVDGVPLIFMGIDSIMDTGSEAYYKSYNIDVRWMTVDKKTGLYAIIPVDNYENASAIEKQNIRLNTKMLNRQLDNLRRTDERANKKYYDHVTVGPYETTNGSHTSVNYGESRLATQKQKDCSEYKEHVDFPRKEGVIRDTYIAENDMNNPETVVMMKLSYERLHSCLASLSNEDAAIAQRIMDGVQSERELARELGISQSTFRGHRIHLTGSLHDKLKCDYEY